MNIVITGSLGHIGRPLTETLARGGHTVTVVSHSPERRAAIEALGARAAVGSLDDAAFLAQVFAGADAAFLMVPPNFAEPDQTAYYRRVTTLYRQAAAGVKRLVLLSSYGAHLPKDTGFILGAHHAEALLTGLPGISLTSLRAGYFYYNLDNFAAVIRHAGRVVSNYGGDDLLPLVAPADIAAAAAEELVKTKGDAVRYVVSEELTAAETAAVLGTAIGIPGLQWQAAPDEAVLNAMIGNGVPEHVAREFVALGAAMHRGVLTEDYLKHRPAVLGTVKLKDYAPEFARRYASGTTGH